MIVEIKKQKGFSLIEVIICVALAGILGIFINTFTLQTITESTKSKNRIQAIMQVENAGYWVSRDVQMAANITLGQDAGFPLQLNRTDIDQNEYDVSYIITEGQIKRILVKNGQETNQTLIAQSINSAPGLTNCNYTDGLLTFNVAATFGNYDVSRTYQIKKRLDFQ